MLTEGREGEAASKPSKKSARGRKSIRGVNEQSLNLRGKENHKRGGRRAFWATGRRGQGIRRKHVAKTYKRPRIRGGNGRFVAPADGDVGANRGNAPGSRGHARDRHARTRCTRRRKLGRASNRSHFGVTISPVRPLEEIEKELLEQKEKGRCEGCPNIKFDRKKKPQIAPLL